MLEGIELLPDGNYQINFSLNEVGYAFIVSPVELFRKLSEAYLVDRIKNDKN